MLVLYLITVSILATTQATPMFARKTKLGLPFDIRGTYGRFPVCKLPNREEIVAGTIFFYYCSSNDYKIEGKRYRRCKFNGEFNAEEPKCVAETGEERSPLFFIKNRNIHLFTGQPINLTDLAERANQIYPY